MLLSQSPETSWHSEGPGTRAGAVQFSPWWILAQAAGPQSEPIKLIETLLLLLTMNYCGGFVSTYTKGSVAAFWEESIFTCRSSSSILYFSCASRIWASRASFLLLSESKSRSLLWIWRYFYDFGNWILDVNHTWLIHYHFGYSHPFWHLLFHL